jgi:hypothetical protein
VHVKGKDNLSNDFRKVELNDLIQMHFLQLCMLEPPKRDTIQSSKSSIALLLLNQLVDSIGQS